MITPTWRGGAPAMAVLFVPASNGQAKLKMPAQYLLVMIVD